MATAPKIRAQNFCIKDASTDIHIKHEPHFDTEENNEKKVDTVDTGTSCSFLVKSEATDNVDTRRSSSSPALKHENSDTNFELPNNKLIESCEESGKKEKTKKQKQTCDTFDCRICGKSLSSKRGLHEHTMQTHRDKVFACPHCPKKYSVKRFLNRHLRTHDPHPIHLCELCDKGFPIKSQLKDHILTHSNERSFFCKNCQRYYKSRSSLCHHRCSGKPRDEMFPYNCSTLCEICAAKFSTMRLLDRHKLTHTLEKPFQCEDCGKGFAQRNNLVAHMRIHTGERPYECDYCDKRFNQKSNANKHMKHCQNRKPKVEAT